MSERTRKPRARVRPSENQPKVVAEMPEDPEVRSRLKEMKENDGYPGSCGI